MYKQTFKSVIEQARQKSTVETARYEAEQRGYMEEVQAKEHEWQSSVFPFMRRASKNDYVQWLKGYIYQGGKPTNCYEYPFSRWEWFVATSDFSIIPLYGSMSKNIIIPAHVNMLGGEKGHSNLYFMDGYKTSGIVPVFSDI